MKYLAVDTSGTSLVIIAVNQKKEYVYHDDKCGVNHSVEIMNKIDLAIRESGLSLSDLDFIACVVGAGSFTGIRIGVSTVKALCFANQIPCLSITSFDTIAYNIKAGKVMAVIDARHGSYYACGYDNGNISIEPCFVSKEELLSLSKGYKLYSFEDVSGLKVKKVKIVDGLKKAIEIKANDKTLDLESLVPLYIRKSQAEEGR